MKKILLYLLFCIPTLLIAQQVELFQQFNGKYDFTAFGNTLNASPNPCSLLPSSTADLNLGPTETLLSAHLYWSGPWPSPNGGDLDVTLNGIPITASRTFSLTSGVGNDYFSAYAEVTNIIALNGNGTYTFADLDIDLAASGACGNGTDFGGWAIYVIYEDPALLLNQISLFDGLEYISATNPSLEIILTNIEVSSDDFSKIGFLAWEGDAAIANNETLLINGFLIDNPPLNPGDNAFNSTNSYTNSNVLYNMDLDFYDLENIIQPGDVSITINLTSSQDFVMVNNIMTSVNSEIPDATITVDDVGVFCSDSNLDIEYTVYNVNSTAPLPANTPIAFYADNVLIGQTQTTVELPIDGSESGVITLFIPGGTPVVFTLKAVVDDDGTGNGIVPETDETNNEFEIIIDLNLEGLDLGPDIDRCFGETVILDADLGDPDFVYQWFFNGVIIPGATNPTYPATQTGTYYVEAFEGICFVSDEILVNLDLQPIAVVPDDLVLCDEVPNDGLAVFDLTVRDAQIINGQPNSFVEYYISQVAAEAGVFPFPTPTAYTNVVPGYQVVFARLEETTLGCYDVVPLVLQVDQAPSITDPITDYFICDNDQDGVEIFDLTSKDAEILNTLINVVLTYHTTELDAQSGTAPIGTPAAYPSGGETIWVRAENLAGCITVGNFDLVLGLVPVYVAVLEFEQCDDEVLDGFTEFDLNSQNGIIIDGNLNLSVTYHGTQGDAEMGVNLLDIPYTNTVNPETIYVRVEDNTTGCYGVFAMDLVVVPPPEIFQPDPLEYCDDDNDGFGEFNLEDADSQVTGGIPTGNLVVTYHYTLEDAQNGVFPLVSLYLNVVPFSQIVYVRLYDQSTGCYNITTLELLVLDSPQIIQPSDLVLCDDDGDGIEIFDLTVVEPELLNGLDPLLYTVTYFEDINLTIPIVNTTSYPNISSPQTIYIVVEDIANGCQSQTIVLLWVNLPPVLTVPTPLELCDVTEIDGPDDEKEPFDLESKTDEITGGDLSITVTYHETQLEADTGDNPLESPYVNRIVGGNPLNPQTIFIRAEDTGTTCIVSQGITLDLVVNPLPSPVTPTPLEACDIDNDGFAEFTLTDKNLEIIGGEPGVVLTYHETLIDAEMGIFALTSPYTNIDTPSQVVFVRAEYAIILGGTGCFRVIELELLVTPTPIIPLDLDDIVVCDDDGFAVFDLTLRAPDIYGTQDPGEYSLTYYIALADAELGVNAIASPEAFSNTINPQTIWVRLEDNITACIKIGEFDVRAELGPTVIQPDPLTLCDDLGDPNDGITVFDLTQKDFEITGGALGVTVRYYETQADAQDDLNAIDPATAYQNTSNPQTIWVRVEDTNTSCFDTSVNLTIRVEANPDPEDPDPIIVCDVNNPGDGEEVFDLTIRESQILDGETWDLTYYDNYDDAVANAGGEIPTPTAYTNTSSPQIIYVRVTIDLLNPESCFEIVELELIVDPLPDDSVAITPYIICEVPEDGFAIFDLTTKIEEILNGQDPLIYQVGFYESQADADLMLNEIQNPEAYQNLINQNPQTIYVGILNIDTGCYVSTQSFEIEERQGAVANTPAPYAICDNWNANDGIAEFDLEDPILLGEILGLQSPLDYVPNFYETLSNAEGEIDPLGDVYVNTINPQVIYVRVNNTVTGCFDITEVILKVELLPIIDIENSYRLCLDEQGNPLPEEFGEVSPPVIDTGLDPSLYVFVWELDLNVILGEIGSSITAIQGGTYTVTVTEILTGCSSTASTTVVVSSPPFVYSAEVISDAFSELHTIEVDATGDGDYEFALDDGPFQDSEFFVDVSPGIHIITIRDKNGCGSVTIELGVIDYPRFVTPNQDGYHDTWNIIGISIGDPTAKIYIFDRYGKLLKQLSPLSEGWDGTYNGNPLPSSDYWFRVEYKENDLQKEFRGHFTLKR